MLISLVAFYAVHKGLDPNTATSQVQGLIDLAVNIVPAGLATYHGIVMFWGLARKALSYFKTGQTLTPVGYTVSIPTSQTDQPQG
jgi:hypothetical protein